MQVTFVRDPSFNQSDVDMLGSPTWAPEFLMLFWFEALVAMQGLLKMSACCHFVQFFRLSNRFLSASPPPLSPMSIKSFHVNCFDAAAQVYFSAVLICGGVEMRPNLRLY